MREGEALVSLPKDDADALRPYAGSPLDTGPEAVIRLLAAKTRATRGSRPACREGFGC